MYLHELSTTGALSFVDFCVDHTLDKQYTIHIPEATQTRANLRGALKQSKRTEHDEKDFLRLVKVVEDYIPQLCGIIGCLAHDEIGLKSEPSFSWRTTLSANVFNTSPRLSLPGCHTDLAFTLLTYGFALSNLARAIVSGLGQYEHDRIISELERKTKDDQLNIAVTFLCRASGIFTYIADTLLPEWENNRGGSPALTSRPPDLSREVNIALAKMALADAQSLAIRKLLSKAAYDNNVAPGPPLPRSHPSPALIAKLHLECASIYTSALALVRTAGERKRRRTSSSPERNVEVSADLRRYLSDEVTFHGALSRKWLGVDAGENGKSEKGGEAVGFLAWAKKDLEEIKDGWRGISTVTGDREMRETIKRKVLDELASVGVFFKYYKKLNDSLHFQPVPSQTELQSRIPAGIMAISAKSFVPPLPAFGPGSVAHIRKRAEELEFLTEPDGEGIAPASANLAVAGTYAGAGSYF
ncbi:BRO1-like domain-containing protein [Collybia nuda]|uniref:pH-response regulator protein palC n=1 Tax=Collybia nuda TaxID=64659 RepID=A0A9P5Y363_9AGAR|nr:BRO1-like domain-containing protein [Collybia nuda]